MSHPKYPNRITTNDHSSRQNLKLYAVSGVSTNEMKNKDMRYSNYTKTHLSGI